MAALTDVYDLRTWSKQCKEASWLKPRKEYAPGALSSPTASFRRVAVRLLIATWLLLGVSDVFGVRVVSY